MRILRLIALSFWLLTSVANAAMTHELCDHAGMSDAGMMDHTGHGMMADNSEDMGDDHHHDGCCDGTCLCGTTISTALSPVAPDLDSPIAASSMTLPGRDDAGDLIDSFDLPPPRLG